MARAAILHDVVEDTDATIDDVRREFGDRVATLVSWLTLSCLDIGRDWRKKRDHQAHVIAYEMDDECRVIKIADKISNVSALHSDPPVWSTKSMIGYAASAEFVVQAAERVKRVTRLYFVSRAILPHGQGLGRPLAGGPLAQLKEKR